MARLVSLQDATGVCASGLALGGLIVTTHPVEGRLLAALPGAEPCEALVVATAPVATDAFAPLAARGWRCQLRITVLRVEGPTKVGEAWRLCYVEPQEHWIGQSLQLHCHPFGGQLSAVRLSGVVCNISEPPGLLLTDVHIAPSFTGGFLVLEDLGEVVGLQAPLLASSSGESVALSLGIAMSTVLDVLLDDDACRAQLSAADVALLPSPGQPLSLPASEERQSVALLWLDSGSWASAIVLSEEGHLLTCAHLLLGTSWMEIQTDGPAARKSTARVCRGRCFASVEGRLTAVSFEADVVQIFEGFMDAALLRVRPGSGARFNCGLWRRHGEPLRGLEVRAVGHGLFGPGSPWTGPAITSGQLCKVVRSGRVAVLQSSCAVHRGCSGGALVADGRLLGMVTTNVKQQDGSVVPRVNFILPVSLLTPLCTYLEHPEHPGALSRLTQEMSFSAANSEERALWRLDPEDLELPSRMAARKRHALRRMDQLQQEAEAEEARSKL